MNRTTGRIDFWNLTGGYGFLDVDGIEDDVFFHEDDSDLAEEHYSEENVVECTIINTEKGPRADKLEIIEVVEEEKNDETDEFEGQSNLSQWGGEV